MTALPAYQCDPIGTDQGFPLANPHVDLAWCYSSDLTGLILERKPDLWIHGHVHQTADYRIGQTRVICNPRGHADERSGFDSGLTVLPISLAAG